MPGINKTVSAENPATLPLSGSELVRVVQGGASVRTTVQDMANLAPVPVNTKGDLYGFGTTSSRIPVGADGDYALIPDSTQTLGVKWDGPFTRVSDLANTSINSKGASLLGFNYSLTYIAGSIGAWLKGLSNGTGASFIGWLSTRAGAVLRTLGAKADDYIEARDFVTGGSGTSASPWTGWDTAIASLLTDRMTVNFCDGYFGYVNSPNWGSHTFVKVKGSGATHFVHTGISWAVLLDGGATGAGTIGGEISGIRVISNSGAAGGVLARAWHQGKCELTFHNVPGACVNTNWVVLGEFDCAHTALFDGITVTPTSLYNLDQRGSGETTSACLFKNTRAGNCSGAAIALQNCVNSTFLGGAAEGSGEGIYVSPTSYGNHFVKIDIESNTGNAIDCQGARNTLQNIYCVGPCSVSGTENQFTGGLYNGVTNSGAGNVYDFVGYNNDGASSFTNTATVFTKRSVYNVTSGTFDADHFASVVNGLTLGPQGLTLDPTAIIKSSGSYVDAALIALFQNGGAGNTNAIYASNGTSANAANAAAKFGANATTGRGIAVGGTVATGGADYAEYMRKVRDILLAKGDIVGITAQGLLTNLWSEAIHFLVKSTDPSFVGGDKWASHLIEPVQPDPEASEDEISAYQAARVAFDAAHEAERQCVDRIAFSGRVPVNFTGALPGDYLVPVEGAQGGIGCVAVKTPDLAQYMAAVGRVIAIESDGRAQIIVRAA